MPTSIHKRHETLACAPYSKPGPGIQSSWQGAAAEVGGVEGFLGGFASNEFFGFCLSLRVMCWFRLVTPQGIGGKRRRETVYRGRRSKFQKKQLARPTFEGAPRLTCSQQTTEK